MAVLRYKNWLPLVALLGALAWVAPANAVTILAGSDYLETLDGTFFVFPLGGEPTVVPMNGLPIPGLGTADTVVRRLEDATCATDGSGTPVSCTDPDNNPTIEIEIVALSLRSVDQITIDLLPPGHVVVLLSDHDTSDGSMTIRHNNNGVDEGTFDSSFDVFFDVFLDVGAPELILLAPNLTHRFESFGSLWSATLLPGTFLVPGPVGDLDANDHTGKGSDEIDFFVTAVQEFVPGPADGDPPLAVHQARSASIPEPGTLGLMSFGLAALVGFARIRRREQVV